ncbi:MAG: response regulator [Chloroflexota bacterium]
MEAQKRVLIVDDEPKMLRFSRIALTAAGYLVITTTSGEDSLRLAREEKPDIMLLDVLMTPLSGFDVLEKLRTFSQVPVIVFTARSLIAEEAMKLGANGVLAKPFRPEELVRKVGEVLGKTI